MTRENDWFVISMKTDWSVTVNAINTATNYQSGAELHVEAALNEHFPFGVALGSWRLYYQQITADGGSGTGLVRLGGELRRAPRNSPSGKWFHEFDVAHRVQGNSVFASLSFRIYRRQYERLTSAKGVRQETRAEQWRPWRGHIATCLTSLPGTGFAIARIPT